MRETESGTETERRGETERDRERQHVTAEKRRLQVTESVKRSNT